MWSWLSVALSGFISISANESNQNKQAVVFKTLSLGMLVVMLWSQNSLCLLYTSPSPRDED